MVNINGGNILLDVDYILKKAGVGPNKVVADLGCGTSGHFVFPLSKAVGKHGRVYAVDILKIALESIARRVKIERAANVTTVWSNLEVFNATKIESSCLDITFLINTLFLSHKRLEIIREAARMLKRDGSLIVVDWQNLNIPFGPPAEERVKKELIINGAKNLGFKFDEEFLAGPYHYGLLFTKM
ncbi:MAG: putative SAM-dependent methyltransferase [Candidatus Falkowbacteria bacterium GW2011_GWC2_38_22]|uniref:Putative SAM-dependent methyltransferase n=1 Tax=Candidatus Falkowbacteria bacterium GW2011_GWE1_38_31 TaxID=1618638 RepID=A0A0G0MZI5_9BACT|nr:MAG: putative SAM-dependent methyltransferase [Candidatus Falkowbacteria bacterium GW2011_GWF2_38_1205]KKQ60979.1 MAG: putative SAM-dependent methyltransferase [Candidatus Falkowbacteria bacterium GW2011_GWC2_38_22]KKQ63492.1 MAG: putative SAM-dependent methyltransferase [Candidatus Falkowbacteria bacterium GW2011_GWF1_38_22]KKQ65437.1 MAG: putative SAM-dependent methyltransferase [Candidatus Falkowbacteria bacterium GW2011_GWE2_38_254]KKQ70256.1 MAG: putative SAM-dependent methyltransferase